MLEQRRVLIAIGGGIAAYKVCEVISTLFKTGCQVRVILTSKSQEFITSLTVSTLSRHPAYTDEIFWQASHSRPLHIELGEWAQVILLAPLTANTLAKLACGMADNLLTNTVLASNCPILLAPAMNTEMWKQISVQRNWRQLQNDPRYHSTGPGLGRLACDTNGRGRMSEPAAIVSAVNSLLYTTGKRDLQDKRILITAGGTQEYLDPVRYIGNPSTGRMGIALAIAAHHRGAKVCLIHAGVSNELLNSLPDVDHYFVTSAQDMSEEVLKQFENTDWLCMAAAVADVKPASYHQSKISKSELPENLPLVPVPDILKLVASRKKSQQTIIGFAAQSGHILTPAKEKLVLKQLDVIVANPIDLRGVGFASEHNQGIFLDKLGREKEIPFCSKIDLANCLFDFVQEFVRLSN